MTPDMAYALGGSSREGGKMITDGMGGEKLTLSVSCMKSLDTSRNTQSVLCPSQT